MKTAFNVCRFHEKLITRIGEHTKTDKIRPVRLKIGPLLQAL